MPRLVSPGPDGIPNACWSGAGFDSAITMQKVYARLACGSLKDYNFNGSVIAFIPKKALAEDEIEMIREAKALRTVNQKNCDPKCCA